MKTFTFFRNAVIAALVFVPAISFAQTELIVEGDFETAYGYASSGGAAVVNGSWTVTNSAAEIAAGVMIEGTKSLRFTTLAQASFATQIVDFGTTDIQGKTFTLKFKARVGSAAGASGIQTNTGQLINASVNPGTTNNPTTAAELGFPVVANTATDAEYSKTFTIVTTGTPVYKLFVRFQKTAGIGYLDLVSLKEAASSAVHETKAESVKIVNNGSTILVVASEPVAVVKVLNANGQVVLSPAVAAEPISVANLSKGVYIVAGKLESGKSFQEKYIVK